MKDKILLELKNVSVRYGGVKALDRVNIRIAKSRITALIGPNGSGKTTVLKAIFGLAPLYSGNILLRGKEILPVSYEMAAQGVVLVPQGRRVFPNLTVEENLEIGGLIIGEKSKLEKRIEQAMEFFPPLKEKRKIKAGAFSGGEQQMIALARGFMVDPEILLLDEPSMGLAPKITKEVFTKVEEIKKKYKTTILIVEHNIKSVLNIADYVYILDKGRVAAEGDSQNLLAGDMLKKVFIGKISGKS